jgi:ParB family chromosome partitioning protein
MPMEKKFKKEEITLIPVKDIIPSPFQPRMHFDEETILNLASSIETLGVIQPIVVRKKNDRYELIAGERRLEAVKFLKRKEIPAIVKDISDLDAFRMAIAENLKRENLNPIEIANAIKNMKEQFHLPDKVVAEMLNMSRSQVTNYQRILKLPPQIKKSIESGEITFGHARSLLSVGEEEREKLYRKIVKQRLSVRDSEQLAKAISKKPTVIRQAEDILTKTLKTKIKITGNKDRGEIRISYFSEDELAEIIKKLVQG